MLTVYQNAIIKKDSLEQTAADLLDTGCHIPEKFWARHAQLIKDASELTIEAACCGVDVCAVR
jgi:hypothetical protein